MLAREDFHLSFDKIPRRRYECKVNNMDKFCTGFDSFFDKNENIFAKNSTLNLEKESNHPLKRAKPCDTVQCDYFGQGYLELSAACISAHCLNSANGLIILGSDRFGIHPVLL